MGVAHTAARTDLFVLHSPVSNKIWRTDAPTNQKRQGCPLLPPTRSSSARWMPSTCASGARTAATSPKLERARVLRRACGYVTSILTANHESRAEPFGPRHLAQYRRQLADLLWLSLSYGHAPSDLAPVCRAIGDALGIERSEIRALISESAGVRRAVLGAGRRLAGAFAVEPHWLGQQLLGELADYWLT